MPCGVSPSFCSRQDPQVCRTSVLGERPTVGCLSGYHSRIPETRTEGLSRASSFPAEDGCRPSAEVSATGCVAGSESHRRRRRGVSSRATLSSSAGRSRSLKDGFLEDSIRRKPSESEASDYFGTKPLAKENRVACFAVVGTAASFSATPRSVSRRFDVSRRFRAEYREVTMECENSLQDANLCHEIEESSHERRNMNATSSKLLVASVPARVRRQSRRCAANLSVDEEHRENSSSSLRGLGDCYVRAYLQLIVQFVHMLGAQISGGAYWRRSRETSFRERALESRPSSNNALVGVVSTGNCKSTSSRGSATTVVGPRSEAAVVVSSSLSKLSDASERRGREVAVERASQSERDAVSTELVCGGRKPVPGRTFDGSFKKRSSGGVGPMAFVGSFRLWALALVAVLISLVAAPADGFVLVSNRGDITLLGPLDIDPQLDDPKIRFKKQGTMKIE